MQDLLKHGAAERQLTVLSDSDITFYHLFQFLTSKELSLLMILESKGTPYAMELFGYYDRQKQDSSGVRSKGKSR